MHNLYWSRKAATKSYYEYLAEKASPSLVEAETHDVDFKSESNEQITNKTPGKFSVFSNIFGTLKSVFNENEDVDPCDF